MVSNELNVNIAKCIVKKDAWGETIVHNVCSHTWEYKE